MSAYGPMPFDDDVEFDEPCPHHNDTCCHSAPNLQVSNAAVVGRFKLEDNGGVPVEERLGLCPALLEKAEVTVYGTVKRVPSPDPSAPKMVCIGRANTSTGWRMQVIETISLHRLQHSLVFGFGDSPPPSSCGLGSLLVEDRCRREDSQKVKERKKMQRITRKQEQRHKRDKYR